MRFERPVILENTVGELRNMSESGSAVFLYADGTYLPGDAIDFAIESPVYNELGVMSKKSLVRCRGIVIRTVQHDKRMGVAVRITKPVVDPGHVDFFA